MKKLLKAVALATVMCMLLSTAAFASFGEATGNEETKLINANVVNAGANEQVVLLIVDKEVEDLAAVEDGDIMYIDQKEADSAGAVSFKNIAIKDTETIVDIYVGSAKTGGPQLIGNDVDVSEAKVITLVESADAIITASTESAEGVKGYAAAITVDTKGLTIDKMIWGFKLADGTRRYSSVIDVLDGAFVEGGVQFAAAFDVGYKTDIEVTGVSAIFLTGEGTDKEATHFTDLEDENHRRK
jgi:hypothetical protein